MQIRCFLERIFDYGSVRWIDDVLELKQPPNLRLARGRSSDRSPRGRAVYDKDAMMQEFCACIDSHCSGPNFDDDEIFMCGMCEPDDKVNFEVEVDVDCDSDMFELVCGIDDVDDDEIVTSEYKSLRDVDGWQRRDPWGGSSASRPNRVSMTNAPTHIISTIFPTSSSPYTSAVPTATSGASVFLSPGRRLLPLMMAG